MNEFRILFESMHGHHVSARISRELSAFRGRRPSHGLVFSNLTVLQCLFCKTGSFNPPHAHLWVWESIIWALVVTMAAGDFRG